MRPYRAIRHPLSRSRVNRHGEAIHQGSSRQCSGEQPVARVDRYREPGDMERVEARSGETRRGSAKCQVAASAPIEDPHLAELFPWLEQETKLDVLRRTSKCVSLGDNDRLAWLVLLLVIQC